MKSSLTRGCLRISLLGGLGLLLLVQSLCRVSHAAEVGASGQPSESVSVRADKTRVTDRQYGLALYEFFQDKPFDALMAFQPLINPGNGSGEISPRLVAAGTYIRYGMPGRATQLLESLLARPASDSEGVQAGFPDRFRAEAHFLLGKAYYQQHRAKEALSQWSALTDEAFAEGLALPQREERKYLLALLYLTQDNSAQNRARAAERYEMMSEETAYRFYMGYNLAVFAWQTGDLVQTEKWTSEVIGELDAHIQEDEVITPEGQFVVPVEGRQAISEARVLQDKARILLALVRMEQGHDGEAIESLSQVMLYHYQADQLVKLYTMELLNSRKTEEADSVLLSYGKIQRESLTAEMIYLSAVIAEQGGSGDRADSLYQQSVTQSLIEQSAIEEAESQMLTQPGDWKALDMRLRPYLSDHREGRGALLALQNDFEFRREREEYEQLKVLLLRAEHWMDQLALFQVVLGERERRWFQRAEEVRKHQEGIQFDRINTHVRALSSTFPVLRGQSQDPLSLLEASQESALARLTQAENRYNSLRIRGYFNAEPERAQQIQQRLQLFRGMMVWQASESYANQKWRHQKVLRAIDWELARYQEASGRVNRRLKTHGDLGQLNNRVNKEIPRVEGLANRLRQALGNTQKQLQNTVSTWLAEQKRAAVSLERQGRLALARMADQRLREKGTQPGGQQ